MSSLVLYPATPREVGSTATIADPTLWVLTVAGVLALLALDFLITRRPHEVSMREAVAWLPALSTARAVKVTFPSAAVT